MHIGNRQIRNSNNADTHSRPVVRRPAGEVRIQVRVRRVINRRRIGGIHKQKRRTSVEERQVRLQSVGRRVVARAVPHHHVRLRTKIVQRRNSPDHRSQRRRDLRIAHIRIVALAPRQIPVNRGVKGSIHLPRSAGELNHIPSRWHILDLESLRLQPAFHRRQIGIRNAVRRPILGRRQPFVIRRRPRILHVRQILCQRLLLRPTPLQYQRDAPGRHRCRRSPPIEPRHRQRMHIAAQRDQLRLIDRFCDAVHWRWFLRALRPQGCARTSC